MKFSRLSRGLISTAGLVLLAAVPTLLLWHRLDLGDVDSFQYMRSGLNLISGKGFLDMSGRPMIFFLDRPLYPLAIGLASFMPFEVTTSARLVSLLSASGAVLAFHWLLSARYPRTIALTAAALFALNPLRVWSGQWIYSDALSLFLVLITAAILFRKERHSLAQSAAAGLLLGLAYLTRAEVVWFALFFLIALLLQLKPLQKFPDRKALKTIGTFVLGFGVCAVAYHVWFYFQAGTWSSARLIYNLHASQAYYDGSSDPVRLNAAASGFEFLPNFDSSLPAMAARYQHYLGFELTRLSYLLGPHLITPALLLLGIVALARKVQYRKIRFVEVTWIGVLASMLLVIPLFFVKDRFLLQVIPAFIFLMVYGVAEVPSWLRRPSNSGLWKSVGMGISGFAVLLILLSYGYRLFTLAPLYDQYAISRQTAQWMILNKDLPKGPIMSFDPSLAFYSGQNHIFLPAPSESPDRVLHYARSQGVRYVFIGSRIGSSPFARALAPPDGAFLNQVRILHSVTVNGETGDLFELNPEAISSK